MSNTDPIPFFIYFIRNKIDLNEQEGKPNCKDIKVAKMFMFTVEPRECQSITEGAEFLTLVFQM
jgi:hypothetical protein